MVRVSKMYFFKKKGLHVRLATPPMLAGSTPVACGTSTWPAFKQGLAGWHDIMSMYSRVRAPSMQY